MKLLIVDDYPLVREGLAAVLSAEPSIGLVEQAATIDEALDKTISLDPDIVLFDLSLGKKCGLELVTRTRGKGKSCKFIVLTSSKSQIDFQRAGDLDVDGYILKTAYPEEILFGIKLVGRGRKYYDPEIMEALLSRKRSESVDRLTIREHAVLKELGKGIKNKEIAENLFITEYTVKKHITRILSKLGLSDRTQAALYANTHEVD